jgi:odorant receptor
MLLDLLEKIKKIYAPIIFCNFLVISILLCVSGFQFVMYKSIMMKVLASFYGSASLINLFIYSYGGQLVMEKSTEVADKLYQTDKDFIIIIARTQKASVFKSLFYEANSSTFTSILSSAASLITLLQSFLE